MSMENAEPYYRTMPCSKVAYIVGATSGANLNDGLQTLIRLYPDCASQTAGSAPTILGDAYTIVRARLTGAKSAAEAAAVLNLTFGMALWLAVGIHILLAELYVSLENSHYLSPNQSSHRHVAMLQFAFSMKVSFKTNNWTL